MSFIYPLTNFTLTQGFGGNSAYYKQFGQQGHNGIDLGAPSGTPVYAADDGTVAFEGWGQNHSWMGTPAGISVLINHGGSYAGYAHLRDTVVSKGQAVKKGQLIGHVGATGAATGPHLHFEMLPLKPDFNNGYAGRINVVPYIVTTKLATDAEIKQAYLDILGRAAEPAALEHYRAYTLDFVRQDLANSQEKRTRDAAIAAQALKDAQARELAAKTEAARLAALEAVKQAEAEKLRIAAEEAAAKAAVELKSNDYLEIAKANSSKLDKLLELVKLIAARFGINL